MATASDSSTIGVTTAYNLMKKRFAKLLRTQKTLSQQLEDAHRANKTIRAKLQSQQVLQDRLTEELRRTICQKSEIYKDLEGEKFQKELRDLILDQYRDEASEHKKTIEEKEKIILECEEMVVEKDRHIEICKESIAANYGEISALKSQVAYLQQRVLVCEEDICALRRQLENNIGERMKEAIVIERIEKERQQAMDGCLYYQKQLTMLESTYEGLEARVDALDTGWSGDQEDGNMT